jgi:peptidoglycan/LPS O-acetylase OafA/YrhL
MPRERAARAFRADIEGLRAVAVALVVLDHAGVGIVAGGYVGVDVFFVISGFLITRLLVVELEAEGRLSLATFYARRMKRLLPLVALVLLAVVVASSLMFSPWRSDAVAGDVRAAALYVVNWRFASQSLDYFGAGVDGSPVEHMWSLSIEEQFYFVWPALLLAATWWWRRRGLDIHRPAAVAVAGIGVVSFAYCVTYTSAEPNAAYFSTLTRAWELALGGALALAPMPAVGRRTASVFGLAGLAAIAWAVVSFTSTTAFPGVAALVPTLGTAALIAAGGMSERSLSTSLLSLPPVRYIGRISYAWYLWHWPVLVFAGAHWGPLSTTQRVGAVLVSAGPAVLSHHLVEQPLRRARSLRLHPRWGLALGAACSAVAVVAAAGLVASEERVPTLAAAHVRGAQALGEQGDPQATASALRPDPVHPGDDRSAMQDDGCLTKLEDTVSRSCVYGDTDSRKTVVLFGDSLAMQYFPALDALAKRHHWRLVGLTKAGCPPVQTDVYNHRLERGYTECSTWREGTLDRIEQRERPAMTIVTGRMSTPAMRDGEMLSPTAGRVAMERGYIAMLERLRATGTKVVAVKDLPRSPRNVPDCVSASLDHIDTCAFARTAANSEEFDARAAKMVRGVRLVDMTPYVCPGGLCRAVIGDAITFRDYDHLTPTFARTLAPMFDRVLPALN